MRAIKYQSIYIPREELIVFHPHPEYSKVDLDEEITDTGDLKLIVKRVLSNLLIELANNFISFILKKPEIEYDLEDPSWKYALIEVKINVEEEVFNKIYDSLVEIAYAGIKPAEASKVLLVIEHV